MKHSLEVIPGVFDAMKAHHVAKFPKDKKIDSYGFFGLSGVIRERGTLSFITNGNCACLGHMPVEKQQDEGLYSESHNMDTPWQQLSMLVAVAATWKWIRTSIPEYN